MQHGGFKTICIRQEASVQSNSDMRQCRPAGPGGQKLSARIHEADALFSRAWITGICAVFGCQVGEEGEQAPCLQWQQPL